MVYETVRVYLAALRYYQIYCGGPDPQLPSLARLHYVIQGTRRNFPICSRPSRLPITPHILACLRHSWSSVPTDYNQTLLWAACCLGFFAFLRSGEFTCPSWAAYHSDMLSPADIRLDNRLSPSCISVTLRRSKTDSVGRGVTIFLGKTDNILCPVSAVLSYLAIRPQTIGPLFLLDGGTPLSRRFLVTSIRAALTSSGLDISRYNGHSFRIGAATAAAEAGLPDSMIQILGRWRSSAFLRYLRVPARQLAGIPQLVTEQYGAVQ